MTTATDRASEICNKMLAHGVTPQELDGLYAALNALVILAPDDRMMHIIGSLVGIGGAVYHDFYRSQKGEA